MSCCSLSSGGFAIISSRRLFPRRYRRGRRIRRCASSASWQGTSKRRSPRSIDPRPNWPKSRSRGVTRHRRENRSRRAAHRRAAPKVLRSSALKRRGTAVDLQAISAEWQSVEVDTMIAVNFFVVPAGTWGWSPGGVMGVEGPPEHLHPLRRIITRSGRMRVSAGVMAGLIDTKTTPVYPQDAKAAHITGAVVLSGVVDTRGKVSELNVLSGPELLRQAAIDAVSQWTYKPFLLNGKPIEVITTMTVHFMLID